MKYSEELNKIVEAMEKLELDIEAQQTIYLGLMVRELATIADELARMNDNNEPIPKSEPIPKPKFVEPVHKPNIDEIY